MKAFELNSFLHSLDRGWMDLNTTVDTIKAGDPDAEVKSIAVGWQSYTWALERAVQLGCNVFITHEPTFYNHYDKADDPYAKLPGTKVKRDFIEQSGLVIIRCHDLWDQMPEIGIPDSWADFLGLKHLVLRDVFYQIYEIPETSAGQFAKLVAGLVRQLGQNGVAFIGPVDKPIRRVGIGTGAISHYYDFVSKYNVDLAICSDDSIDGWKDGEYAIDHQIPIIVANHAVSEEIGIRNLARFLQESFPFIRVCHIPQGCIYQLIEGDVPKS